VAVPALVVVSSGTALKVVVVAWLAVPGLLVLALKDTMPAYQGGL
jgi:hypothetical protein